MVVFGRARLLAMACGFALAGAGVVISLVLGDVADATIAKGTPVDATVVANRAATPFTPESRVLVVSYRAAGADRTATLAGLWTASATGRYTGLQSGDHLRIFVNRDDPGRVATEGGLVSGWGWAFVRWPMWVLAVGAFLYAAKASRAEAKPDPSGVETFEFAISAHGYYQSAVEGLVDEAWDAMTADRDVRVLVAERIERTRFPIVAGGYETGDVDRYLQTLRDGLLAL